MRKYIVGALVGFLLSVPFTAFGEQIATVIGKKVQIEYPVVVNGKQLDTKAIAINGVSYTPNRAVADALSVDVAFENKTVVLTGGAPVTYYTLDTIDDAIKSVEGLIFTINGSIISNEEKGFTKNVENLKAALVKNQAELERLNTVKANLQALATPTP